MEQKFGKNSIDIKALREFCEREGKMVEYRKGEQLERETKALKQLDTFLSLKRMVIVTNDEEGTVPLKNGKQIEVIPAWKWLLE